MAELSYEEELRYNRQIILKAVDFDGQEKLKDSRPVSSKSGASPLMLL